MIKRAFLAFSILLCAALPAAAQFADQATDAGTGAGSANAQTITLANVSSYNDVIGVLIKIIPGATNSGDMTLSINGLSSPPHVKKPTGSGMGLLTGFEFTSGQQVVVKLDASGFFNLVSPTSLPIGAAGLLNSALAYGVPINLQLNATVGTNALTIAVKGNNGSDPSVTNPVLLSFRDSTIANGGPKIVPLTSALGFTIASGSTMGCVSGTVCRLWVVAICSTGLECTGSAGSDVVGLCAFNARVNGNVAGINTAALQTSASGTGGGNSAQTYYCNISAVTARAIMLLGYVEITESVAGTWASGPTFTQLFGPGIKKPGDVVQVAHSGVINTLLSLNIAIQQSAVAAAITPTSTANVVNIVAPVSVSSGATFVTQIQLSRGASPTLIGPFANLGIGTTGASPTGSITLQTADYPQTTSPVTYYVYGSSTSNGGGSINPNGAGSSMEVQEIMGSLEPANDNAPLEMTG